LHRVHGANDTIGEERGGCCFEYEYAHESMASRILPCK
jgi:hypothetical protein